MSRPGRISKVGHVYTIVRNVCGEDACDAIGIVRLLTDPDTAQQVRIFIDNFIIIL